MQCQNLFTVEWESILFLEQKENHITFHENSGDFYILYIDAKNPKWIIFSQALLTIIEKNIWGKTNNSKYKTTSNIQKEMLKIPKLIHSASTQSIVDDDSS